MANCKRAKFAPLPIPCLVLFCSLAARLAGADEPPESMGDALGRLQGKAPINNTDVGGDPFNGKEPPRTLAELNETLAKDPNDTRALYDRAVLHEAESQFAEA